jgi:hypothetical protein
VVGLFFIFIKKNIEIHVFEEEVVLIMCSQIACMLDKYFIKRYAIGLIFTQYVLCENARLVSTMIFWDLQRWYLDFWIVSRTFNVNSFF